MNNYTLSLALTYFKEKRNTYVISELMETLGYNHKQIDSLLSSLMQKGYLQYVNDLLSITPKGLAYLIGNDQGNIKLQVDNLGTPHINPQKAQKLDVPYVPVGFVKKYKG